MRKFYLIIFVLAGIFCFNQVSFAQKNLKIGIVNLDKIFQEMPEAIEATNQIAARNKSLEDTLKIFSDSLEADYNNFMTQKSMMPEDQQQRVMQELQMRDQQRKQFNEYRYAVLQQLNAELEKPIKEKLNKAIAEVAKEQKLNLVLNNSTTNSNSILYHDDSMDITFLVLDKLRRGNTK